MKLSELKIGEKASIVKVLGQGGFRKRITEMGFVKGKVVETILNAPLRDPIKYKIMDFEVALRRKEAELIEVVSEKEAVQYIGENKKLAGLNEEDKIRNVALNKRKTIKVALVGNPNCGKTTLFNIASKSHEHVGNYSGVTIDSKEGFFTQDGYQFEIIDLPGTYSLSAYSPEEKYVREYLVEKMPDIVINVLDSSNLERNLFLTTQLIDMHLQCVVALNMYDELQKNGNILDYDNLGKLLGLPFVPIIAKTGFGIKDLFQTVIKLYEGSYIIDKDGVLISTVQNDEILDKYHHEINISHSHGNKNNNSDLNDNRNIYKTVRHIHINHGIELEKSIKRIKEFLIKNNFSLQYKYSIRSVAIKLLENDTIINNLISKENDAAEIYKIRNEEQNRILGVLKTDAESAITDAKYGYIAGALKETYTISSKKEKTSTTDKIDAIVTHKFWGYPIFIAFLFIMFHTTFTLGRYPMDWIEASVAWLGNLLGGAMPNGVLKDLLIDGIISGVGGVIVFLPNILILYLFISLMEDTGYMARAAFIMDKIMHKIGLHGKSFIPLVMGFGCNVPAIMATRTIENRNSRIITILINPLISCSARLPIYILLVTAFFPKNGALVMTSIYAIGIACVAIMAKIFSKFVFKKEETPFVMELPPYRMPTTKSITFHMWEKSKLYLKKIGTIILAASIVIWCLGYFPQNVDYSKNYNEIIKKTTAEYENKIFKEKNNDAKKMLTENFENKVKTYNAEKNIEHQEKSYIGKIGKFVEPVIKPLGFDWKIGIALLSGIMAKEVVVSTLSVLYTGNGDNSNNALSERMKTEKDSNGKPKFNPLIAFGLMIFSMLYFPCVATLGAIKNETGTWKYAIFTLTYTVLLAWTFAFLIHKIGTLIL